MIMEYMMDMIMIEFRIAYNSNRDDWICTYAGIMVMYRLTWMNLKFTYLIRDKTWIKLDDLFGWCLNIACFNIGFRLVKNMLRTLSDFFYDPH